MKKVMLVVMGFLCLLLVVGKVQAADCTFSDVPETHPFYDEITGICELGITQGYDDGTYRPTNNITRAAMSAFLMRMMTKVIDNNDQYLGYFFDTGDECLKVFVPSLKKRACISTYDGDIAYECELYFESTDCTGQAYSSNDSAMYQIVKNSGEYYTGVFSIPGHITSQSWKAEGSCHIYNSQFDAFPVFEVALPFAMPVALPMRLE